MSTLISRFRLQIAATDVVYLNSSRVVSEILEKRSAITSSRPPLPMVSDIVSGGKRMVVMPYNGTWRKIRKLFHQVFHDLTKLTKILMSREAERYHPIMEKESVQLVWEYYTSPKDWYLHNSRYSNRLFITMKY
jgi:Cytochrome P450